MLALLEQARLQSATSSKEGYQDFAGADQLYAGAFQGYGVDVLVLGLREAAGRLRRSVIRTHLVAALVDWAYVRNNLHRGAGAPLSALTELADNDPWRQRLRSAGRRGNWSALARLAKEKQVRTQSPLNLVLLARSLQHAHRWAAAERLLRGAQQAHPSDFWINFQLADNFHLKGEGGGADAVRFYQTALALRPESALVYNDLGVALEQ
jgi:hypothetical protein